MLRNLYEDLAPPIQGQVFMFAHSTTAARFEIPPQWRGQIVNFISTGSDLSVLLGDGNVNIEAAEVGAVVSEVPSANWASGALVPAGATLPIPVPAKNDRPNITHFVVDSSGATGYWCAFVASGNPRSGEQLAIWLGKPLLDLDASSYGRLTISSGVASWRDREGNYAFAEATNKPALLTAVSASSGMQRPAIGFTAASSHKLQSTDADLAAALGSARSFTLLILFRRTATGAAHCLFSVGTGGSDNGRWDVTIDASDDVVITRVDSAGNSTTSTYATTVSAAMHSLLITFDGTTPLAWLDGASVALTGTAAGDVGTTTKVTVGARAYNTSTVGNYAGAEISRIIAFPDALTGTKLAELQGYARRIGGV